LPNAYTIYSLACPKIKLYLKKIKISCSQFLRMIIGQAQSKLSHDWS
jgi:hypothetical protein